MANNKSALKRNRQNERRRIQNRAFRNRMRTYVKRAREALAAGKDVALAETVTRVAVRDLDMAAQRGTIHKRNAARRKSRLMKRLAALKKAAGK